MTLDSDFLKTRFPKFFEDWKNVQGPHAPLLRRTLIRNLLRSLHAFRSQALASAKGSEIPTVRNFEERLRQVSDSDLAFSSLEKVFETRKSPAPEVALSPLLGRIFGPQKLDRFDRSEEKKIAHLAEKLGWEFWTLDATVDVAQAEEFHTQIGEALWPQALSLFVEALPSSTQLSGWRGRWFWVINPDQVPSVIEKDLSRLPGLKTTPEPPEWTCLSSA